MLIPGDRIADGIFIFLLIANVRPRGLAARLSYLPGLIPSPLARRAKIFIRDARARGSTDVAVRALIHAGYRSLPLLYKNRRRLLRD